MFSFFHRTSSSEEHIQLIQSIHKSSFDVQPSHDFRQTVRSRFLCKLHQRPQQPANTKIDDYHVLIQAMKFAFEQVNPSVFYRARLKERILAVIEKGLVQTVQLRPFRAWMGIVVSVVLVLFVSPFFHQAGRFSNSDVILTVSSGNSVSVLRQGEIVSVGTDKPFLLAEGDVLVAPAESFSTVTLFNDLIVRLSPDSQILLKHVSVPNDQDFASQVSIEILRGRIWSHVVGTGVMFSNYLFISGDITVSPYEKAVFDIQRQQKILKVVVFDSFVEAVVRHTELNYRDEITIVAGHGVEFSSGKKNQIFAVSPDEFYFDEWISQNKTADKKLISELSERQIFETRKNAGVLPNSPFYVIAKSVPEQTRRALTFDPLAKEQLNLDLANQRLLEAQVLLLEGQMEQASLLIQEFQVLIESVILQVNAFYSQGDSRMNELRADIERALSLAERTLEASSSAPNEFFEIKDWIQQIRLLIPSLQDIVTEQIVRSGTMSALLKDMDASIKARDFIRVSDLFERYREEALILSQKLEDISSQGAHVQLASELLMQRLDDLSYILVIQTDLSQSGIYPDDLQDLALIVSGHIQLTLDVLVVDGEHALDTLALVQRIKRLTVQPLTIDVLNELKTLVKKLI